MCQWFVDDFVLNLREECLLAPCAAAGVYVPACGSVVFLGFRKMLELARPLGLATKHGAWAPDSYDDIAALVHQVRSHFSKSDPRVNACSFPTAWLEGSEVGYLLCLKWNCAAVGHWTSRVLVERNFFMLQMWQWNAEWSSFIC
jgi:hypothetical protein